MLIDVAYGAFQVDLEAHPGHVVLQVGETPEHPVTFGRPTSPYEGLVPFHGHVLLQAGTIEAPRIALVQMTIDQSALRTSIDLNRYGDEYRLYAEYASMSRVEFVQGPPSVIPVRMEMVFTSGDPWVLCLRMVRHDSSSLSSAIPIWLDLPDWTPFIDHGEDETEPSPAQAVVESPREIPSRFDRSGVVDG